MSGFDKMLGAMDAREMLECARGLLRVLAGAEASSAAPASGGVDGDVGRAGAGEASWVGEAGEPGGVRDLAAAGRGGRGVRSASGGERTRRGGACDELEGAESAPERGGTPESPERWERYFDSPSRGRERVSRDETDASGGAAFAGPERRFDNAAGARGMEMSRVSDFFRRDSRRYDGGFTRY